MQSGFSAAGRGFPVLTASAIGLQGPMGYSPYRV